MANRFYFHLIDGKQRIVDLVGIEMPDEAALWREPLKLVIDRWPTTRDAKVRSEWSVEIVDGGGRVVLLMPLDELD